MEREPDDPPPEPLSSPELGQPWVSAQDMGTGIIAFEHVNLEVTDLEAARLFYGEGLGLTQDPSRSGAQRGGAHVVWYNLGRTQLHIAHGPEPQWLPQGGAIGLVLPDLDAVEQQLQAVAPLLNARGAPIQVSREAAGGPLVVMCPQGAVTFELHSLQAATAQQEGGIKSQDPWAQLPREPCIAYLRIPCLPGTARDIARFYQTQLGARVRVGSMEQASQGQPESSSSGFGHGLQHADILMGVPGTRVTFIESRRTSGYRGQQHQHQQGGPGTPDSGADRGDVLIAAAGAEAGPPGQPVSREAVLALCGGFHMCFYIGDFSAAYRRLRPVLFNSHPYRDKVHCFEDALRNRQFRFQDVVRVPASGCLEQEESSSSSEEAQAGAGPGRRPGAEEDGGAGQEEVGGNDRQGLALLFRVSHEVRSLAHWNFLRPLLNRGPSGGLVL